MSESLVHIDVAEQISFLADMSGAKCTDFQHQIINSKTAYTQPTEANVITYTVPANFAFIVTFIDIKTLYDTADAVLLAVTGGDFRSSFDLNPWGPYLGAGAVGQIRLLINDQQYGATPAYDIGIMNRGVLFVVLSGRVLKIAVNPFQPAAKTLTLVTVVNGYLVPQIVGETLKKNETQILAG